MGADLMPMKRLVRRWILLAVAVGLVALGVVYLPRFIAFLRIGTVFAAQQTCACVHLGNRPLESCVAELGKPGRLLKVEAEGDSVRTSALLGLFTAESRNEEPFGCHPVK
jgi:hypothetical protein